MGRTDDEGAGVHELGQADQVHVFARVAADGIAARKGAVRAPALAAAVDDVADGLQHNLLEGIGVEPVHQVVVLLVRDEPPVLRPEVR